MSALKKPFGSKTIRMVFAKDKLAFSLLIAPDNLISLNVTAFYADIFQQKNNFDHQLFFT